MVWFNFKPFESLPMPPILKAPTGQNVPGTYKILFFIKNDFTWRVDINFGWKKYTTGYLGKGPVKIDRVPLTAFGKNV